MTKGRMFQLLLLAVLCALPPLSIDMGLPGLPALGRAFGVSAGYAALTITLFMAGFALSPIVYGTLSDRWGRRPLLIGGLLLFALGGVACLFTPSLNWLFVSRFVQGLGAGCGPTLAFAATRDQLSGRALGQRLAMLTMLLNSAPIVAPSLGTLWLYASGWRGSYIVLAMGGVLLFIVACAKFDETKPNSPAQSGGIFEAFLRDTAIIRCRPDIFLPGLIYGLSAGAMFAYVSLSSLLFMKGLGASPALYAGLFAMTGAATCSGAYASGCALRRVSPLKLMLAGQSLMVLAACMGMILLGFHVHTIPPVIFCMIVAMFGYGLIAPASAHATLDPVPDIAGTASAMMNSGQMTCMALSSLCGSLLFRILGDVTAPLVMMIFALVSTGCFLVWWYQRPRALAKNVAQH